VPLDAVHCLAGLLVLVGEATGALGTVLQLLHAMRGPLRALLRVRVWTARRAWHVAFARRTLANTSTSPLMHLRTQPPPLVTHTHIHTHTHDNTRARANPPCMQGPAAGDWSLLSPADARSVMAATLSSTAAMLQQRGKARGLERMQLCAYMLQRVRCVSGVLRCAALCGVAWRGVACGTCKGLWCVCV
jgi:hypothetical protein